MRLLVQYRQFKGDFDIIVELKGRKIFLNALNRKCRFINHFRLFYNSSLITKKLRRQYLHLIAFCRNPVEYNDEFCF